MKKNLKEGDIIQTCYICDGVEVKDIFRVVNIDGKLFGKNESHNLNLDTLDDDEYIVINTTDNSHIFNKYGNISGGYIFDVLDRKAHLYAIESIGECVTVNAEIKYFSEIKEFPIGNLDCFSIGYTKNTITIVVSIPEVSMATFTFVKRKDDTDF